MYQALKIDPLVMFGLPNRTNGLDLVLGANIIQKILSYGSRYFFSHIDW